MKRLKFLLTLAMMTFMLAAITAPTYAQNRTVKSQVGATYVIVPVTAADTVSANRTTWYTLVNNYSDDPSTQDVLIVLDSISGSGTVAVLLQGRKFDEVEWTNIGSAVTWHATASTTNDTTIVISNATANRYRQFKLGLTSTSTIKSKPEKLEFKIWNE